MKITDTLCTKRKATENVIKLINFTLFTHGTGQKGRLEFVYRGINTSILDQHFNTDNGIQNNIGKQQLGIKVRFAYKRNKLF